MKNVLKLLGLSLAMGFTLPAYAQTQAAELTCSGTLSHPRDEGDFDLSGVMLRISDRSIKIIGSLFDGDYPITSRDEVYLSISSDSYLGGINRFSGKFYIVRNGIQPNTWAWRYSSICTRPNPLF